MAAELSVRTLMVDGLTVTVERKHIRNLYLRLRPDGSFVYTPLVGRRGRDYFGYKAVDARGNLSQEATVIIRLTKPEC